MLSVIEGWCDLTCNAHRAKLEMTWTSFYMKTCSSQAVLMLGASFHFVGCVSCQRFLVCIRTKEVR